MCRRSLSVFVLAVCILSMPVSAELVGWWKFDDGAGTTAADSSGRGQNGTLTNGPTWNAAGVYGGCLQFDGTNDRVAVTGTWTLPQYTVTFWFRQDGGVGSQKTLICLQNATVGASGFMAEIGTDGRVRFSHRAPFAATGGAANENLYVTGPAAGAWHHLALVKTATDMMTYIDGVQAGTQANANTFDMAGTSLTIGDLDNRQMRPWNGLIDDVRIYNTALTAAEIQQVKSNIGNRGYSTSPRPGDKAQDVQRETALSWQAGEFAAAHDVYLGTAAADVANATRANPLGVLAEQDLDVNDYDPPGRFELGQTYFWRVDEVNAAPSTEIFTGSVWSFTVEPHSYPVAGVTATASSFASGMGPEKAVDGSGLTGDTHSTTSTDMWLSAKKTPAPAWMQFAFDKVYKLDKVLVWNSNQASEADWGLGAKNVVVEYSTDADTWISLGEVEIPQAPGAPTCTASTVDLKGAVAQYVKFTINSNWGDDFITQYGLSEVRFYCIPLWAREPAPAAAATGVTPPVTLSWRAGREAASHQVILGTDQQAVAEGTAPAVTVAEPQYEAPLDLAQNYFWKVAEVNDAEVPSAWESPVWSFRTADYIVVDDFESYTDEENMSRRIYETWIDGWNDPSVNGAVVGYSDPPFAERTVVNGGSQSMPLAYTNPDGSVHSEAERTFSPAQDWTKYAVTSLVLWFRGDPNNTPATLYVKINDTKVLFNNDAAATTFPVWKQWNIDLASLSGVNLKAVKKLTIGVSGAGSGTLYIDDVRLYRTAPASVAPVDPGTTGLVSYLNMEGGKVSDSVSGITGTLNNVMFTTSMTGLGQAARFDNTASAYVDLGADYWTKVVSKLASCTFSVWVNDNGTGGVWERVFDLGCGQNVYVFLTTGGGTAGIARFAVKTDVPNSGSTGTGFVETGVNGPRALSAGWHHLAGVVDATGGTAGSPVLYLYVDGVLAAGPSAGRLPKDMVLQAGTPWQMWLGRSQWTADPYFSGSIDDLRVYNRALSAGEIRYLAGDR